VKGWQVRVGKTGGGERAETPRALGKEASAKLRARDVLLRGGGGRKRAGRVSGAADGAGRKRRRAGERRRGGGSVVGRGRGSGREGEEGGGAGEERESARDGEWGGGRVAGRGEEWRARGGVWARWRMPRRKSGGEEGCEARVAGEAGRRGRPSLKGKALRGVVAPPAEGERVQSRGEGRRAPVPGARQREGCGREGLAVLGRNGSAVWRKRGRVGVEPGGAGGSFPRRGVRGRVREVLGVRVARETCRRCRCGGARVRIAVARRIVGLRNEGSFVARGWGRGGVER